MNDQVAGVEIEIWENENLLSVGERISDVMRRYAPAIIWHPTSRHWWCAYRHGWVGRADTKPDALALVRAALEQQP